MAVKVVKAVRPEEVESHEEVCGKMWQDDDLALRIQSVNLGKNISDGEGLDKIVSKHSIGEKAEDKKENQNGRRFFGPFKCSDCGKILSSKVRNLRLRKVYIYITMTFFACFVRDAQYQLKFWLRDLISCFCCVQTSHAALKQTAEAAAEHKQELSSINPQI